jgi:hypothetical protein
LRLEKLPPVVTVTGELTRLVFEVLTTPDGPGRPCPFQEILTDPRLHLRPAPLLCTSSSVREWPVAHPEMTGELPPDAASATPADPTTATAETAAMRILRM